MTLSTVLTSAANPLLKDIRRAQQRGTVTEKGWMIAEGPHLLEEAWRSNLRIRCAILSEGALMPAGVVVDRVIEVTAKVFQSISGTSTPQGVLALVEPKLASFREFLQGVPLIVVLDGVQDPGNAGGIARAAEAFGATGFVFAKGSVSPFHPKTIRASAGSLFRLPFMFATNEETIAALAGIATYTGVPAAPHVKTPWETDFTQPLALVIGSEGHGVDPRFLLSSQPVAIPTAGVESLNAAVAAGILLYEIARQRGSQ